MIPSDLSPTRWCHQTRVSGLPPEDRRQMEDVLKRIGRRRLGRTRGAGIPDWRKITNLLKDLFRESLPFKNLGWASTICRPMALLGLTSFGDNHGSPS